MKTEPVRRTVKHGEVLEHERIVYVPRQWKPGTPTLTFSLDSESIEEMREKGVAALGRLAHRECFDDESLVDRILTALGITIER